MNGIGRSFGMASRQLKMKAVADFSPVNEHVQHHLVRVYGMLAAGLVSACAGVALHTKFHVGGLLSAFAMIGLVMWLSFTPNTPENTSKRFAMFAGLTFLKGASIGPLVALVARVDPSIIVTAFLGTVAIFTSFSAAAYYAQRRSYLFLGGILGSALSCLTLVSLANLFFWSDALFSIQLYVGLVMFCGFVLFDTQLIIEKAAAGDNDAVWHAVELFIDFMAIFVRLLIILAKMRGNSNSSSGSSNDRDSRSRRR